MPDLTPFDRFLLAEGARLRAADRPPTTLADWQTRRSALRQKMFQAMGGRPDSPGELQPRIVNTLKRDGYRIENILFQSRPDVWVTANAYVPEKTSGPCPAVLAVHGHWAGARRDPTVQARCLGLVKLGFFVLVVDAFSAGERHPSGKPGSYHGALLGSTLWPSGTSLLGVQVFENQRAVDYLLTRPEVDGSRIGITGASGGGNQSMYAGALDERIKAVVPVCSIGRYQAYLQAACCVCEVLPSALRFTEEGDVLGLVAPRALLVINATRDSLQFSPGEAKKSLERARAIYQLHGKEEALAHAVFESPHDYNQAMREAMYGWMTRWLKGEGDGKPIPEPKHTTESAEDLACFPGGKRPASFVFAPDLAAIEARRLLAWSGDAIRDHPAAWEGRAVVLRARLEEALGPFPEKVPARRDTPPAGSGKDSVVDIPVEPGLTIPMTLRPSKATGRQPVAILLHLDGRDAALAHPLAGSLTEKGVAVVVPELRATGAAQPKGDAIAGAPDHNSAEHAVWLGRPLLGQWHADLRAVLDYLVARTDLASDPVTLVGIGQAGVVAITAGARFPERVRMVLAIDPPTSFIRRKAYPEGTRMGLLAPGILRAGDIPHLAALIAPRPLVLAGGVGPDDKKLDRQELREAFAFTRAIYRLLGAEKSLQVTESLAEAGLVR